MFDAEQWSRSRATAFPAELWHGARLAIPRAAPDRAEERIVGRFKDRRQHEAGEEASHMGIEGDARLAGVRDGRTEGSRLDGHLE